jgi:adenosylcobinamide kinase/adenosylcobinamide-phosphate guanylyltransferase
MQGARPNRVTFVLGGARSGKSRFAQRIASGFEKVIFLATAKPSDPEMALRIERHRRSRPSNWQTLEVSVDIDLAIASLRDPQQFAIVDCLTVYLANLMSEAQEKGSKIREHTDRLCSAVEEAKSPVVLVSNEVGSGVHPLTASGRLYCDLLGELNQRVAALADNVILMVAGIPFLVKGKMPPMVQPDFEMNELLGTAP